MLSTLLLASATLLPTDHQAFLETLEAANVANQEKVTVCVQPPASLYADNLSDDEVFETPIGKVEAISKDIAIIKNAIETGSAIKDATVDVAVSDTPKNWTQWLYLAIGALGAFILKLAFSVCVRFKEVCVKVNQILKQAEDNEKPKTD